MRRRRDGGGKEGHVWEEGDFTEKRADEENVGKEDGREDGYVCLPCIGCCFVAVNPADGFDPALLFEIRMRSKEINLDGFTAGGIVRLHKATDFTKQTTWQQKTYLKNSALLMTCGG